MRAVGEAAGTRRASPQGCHRRRPEQAAAVPGLTSRPLPPRIFLMLTREDAAGYGAEHSAPGSRRATESPVDEARPSATQRELRQNFPWVPPEQIDMLVEGIWRHYEAARVRDFVPLLVRKQAEEELREIVQVSPVPDSGPPELPARTSSPQKVALQQAWYPQPLGSLHRPSVQP